MSLYPCDIPMSLLYQYEVAPIYYLTKVLYYLLYSVGMCDVGVTGVVIRHTKRSKTVSCRAGSLVRLWSVPSVVDTCLGMQEFYTLHPRDPDLKNAIHLHPLVTTEQRHGAFHQVLTYSTPRLGQALLCCSLCCNYRRRCHLREPTARKFPSHASQK
ncbi:hypothetical protein F4808DRAFT_40960 [Astrocystis sublimbata]|nr:hypothetical protein F4808DRAFT_40960 [Astrocystis sublimbata]